MENPFIAEEINEESLELLPRRSDQVDDVVTVLDRQLTGQLASKSDKTCEVQRNGPFDPASTSSFTVGHRVTISRLSVKRVEVIDASSSPRRKDIFLPE